MVDHVDLVSDSQPLPWVFGISPHEAHRSKGCENVCHLGCDHCGLQIVRGSGSTSVGDCHKLVESDSLNRVVQIRL